MFILVASSWFMFYFPLVVAYLKVAISKIMCQMMRMCVEMRQIHYKTLNRGLFLISSQNLVAKQIMHHCYFLRVIFSKLIFFGQWYGKLQCVKNCLSRGMPSYLVFSGFFHSAYY